MVKLPKHLHDKNEGIKDGIHVKQVKCPNHKCGFYNIVPINQLYHDGKNMNNVAVCARCNTPLVTNTLKKPMVKYYILHLPAYLLPQQIDFIKDIASQVVKGIPLDIINHPSLLFLLRKTVEFRNLLITEEREEEWNEKDNIFLEKLLKHYKPLIDILKNSKVQVKEFRRD